MNLSLVCIFCQCQLSSCCVAVYNPAEWTKPLTWTSAVCHQVFVESNMKPVHHSAPSPRLPTQMFILESLQSFTTRSEKIHTAASHWKPLQVSACLKSDFVSYLWTSGCTGSHRLENQGGTGRCRIPARWSRRRCGGTDPADTRLRLNRWGKKRKEEPLKSAAKNKFGFCHWRSFKILKSC